MTLLISSCSLAPDFTLPDTATPEVFNESGLPTTTGPQCHWQEAKPLAKEDRGLWWKIFDNAELNDLEKQAGDANQDLQTVAARVAEARATAESNSPSFLPDFDIGGNAVRAKSPSTAGVGFGVPAVQQKPYTLYSATGTLSYEVDLFDSVRDNYKAYSLDADAQEAAYKSTLLSLQADVAQNYFTIRALDAQRKLLRDTVTMREEAQRIMQHRFDYGEVGQQDLSRTQTDLASTKADLLSLDRQRTISEHALAVLLGKLPEQYTIAEASLDGMPPPLPPGLPSSLLLRRPDVASAQFTMAAANARIGVARAAFFPTISLTANGGYQSTGLSNLFLWSNRTWALGQVAGSAITMPIFDSGRNLARLDFAHAQYDEAVANYRQQVLVAFRDVEDNLTNQHLLADQYIQQNIAAQASQTAEDILQKRYKEGDVDFFQVVQAQRDSLAATRAAIDLRGQRFITTVGLVRALGGGWDDVKADTATEPAPADVKPETAPTVDTSAKPPEESPKTESPAPDTTPVTLPAPEAPKAEAPAVPTPLIDTPADLPPPTQMQPETPAVQPTTDSQFPSSGARHPLVP